MSQPPEYPGSERLKRIAKRSSAGGAYEGAFEAVGAILIATLLGYWFDESYGTTPTGVLVGAGIGFAAFVLRLVRLGRQLHPDATSGSTGDVAEETKAANAERPRPESEGADGIALGLGDLGSDDEEEA